MQILRHPSARLINLCFIALTLSACAAIRVNPLPEAVIPADSVPTPEARYFAGELLEDLEDNHAVDSTSDRAHRLNMVFERVAEAAKVKPESWEIYLFDDPEIANLRAIHGQYLFAWSGLFDVMEKDDELAGLLASELAHNLAGHTKPVQFNAASELLFSLTDVVAALGLAVASQGMITVQAPGLTRWAYVEAADLDPMDREYSEEEVLEMATIALLILEGSSYSPEALTNFWTRIRDDQDLQRRVEPLIRGLSPEKRLALIDDAQREISMSRVPTDLGSTGSTH